MTAPKRVAILGSTGSIGTQALDVIASHPERFEVVGLAAGRNESLLREQVQRFGARVATTIADGPEGLLRVAVSSEPDIVLAATDGSVAFDAVFAAVERGIDIAVANKELIVSAGALLVESAQRSGARLLPVDSEHSAIFQCLAGRRAREHRQHRSHGLRRPVLAHVARSDGECGSEGRARAPDVAMGTKNTIDSATMMNKGLEVIEASRLFGFPGDQIGIVVHPQSIAHGFVIFTDGSVKSQLAAPDMRLPIGYALAYPNRLPSVGGAEPAGSPISRDAVLQILGAKQGEVALRYDFEAPDPVRFPCVGLAYEALARGGTAPAVLSAANEVAVDAFVQGKIAFGKISAVIEQTMERTRPGPANSRRGSLGRPGGPSKCPGNR